MAEVAKALSDFLDGSQPKESRLTTLSSLLENLDHRERLGGVLDAVHSKWKRLTDLFLTERNVAIVQKLSHFLSDVGKTAILYGRFSGSKINPFVYVSWIQQQLSRPDVPPEKLEMLLEGLGRCLGDLEGSAFKSVAPSLLTACRTLLNRAETPITIFPSLLHALQPLCKVQSAVRDQFVQLVDLTLGWGSCSAITHPTAVQIRSLFQLLSPNWEFHMDYGSELIISILKDLNSRLDSSFESAEVTWAFVNTASCLTAIFESCAPFVQESFFPQVLAHVRCMVRVAKLVPVTSGGSRLLEGLAERLGEQICLAAELLMKSSLAHGLPYVVRIVTEALEEVQRKPETAVRFVQMHRSLLLKFLDSPEMQHLCHGTYGHSSCFHNLRLSSWRGLVEAIAEIYEILLSQTPPNLHLFFLQLFLEDVTGGRRFSWGAYTTSGGHNAANNKRSNSNAAPCAALGRSQIQNQTHFPKKQLFAVTLFLRCLRHEKYQDLSDPVWEAISDLHRSGKELHPLVMLRSVKLQMEIWRVASTPLPVLDAIAVLMKMPVFSADDEISLFVLEWLRDVIQGQHFKKTLPLFVEDLLLERVTGEGDLNNRLAALAILHAAIAKGVVLTRAQAILQTIQELVSDVNVAMADKAMEVLKDCGSLCLLQPVEGELLAVVLQPQSYDFKSSHLVTFLKKLTAGPMTSKPPSAYAEWMAQLCQEISVSYQAQSSGLKMEDAPTVFRRSHLLVHEAAKALVSNRFRTVESGPSKVLKLLNERLSELKHHLQSFKPIDMFHLYLMVDFISALEKQIFCGYDGAHFTQSPPQKTWAYYAANKPSFEEGFGRLLSKLLFVSHRCGLHHHAAQFGNGLLMLQNRDCKKYIAELQQCAAPKQTVIKLRQRPAKDVLEKLTQFLGNLMEGLQLSCGSLISLSAAACIEGLQAEMMPRVGELMQCITSVDMPGLLGWMESCRDEAEQRYERAGEGYRQYYVRMSHALAELREMDRSEAPACLIPGLQLLQQFLLERQAICCARVENWEALEKLEVFSEASLRDRPNVKFMQMLMQYGKKEITKAVECLELWPLLPSEVSLRDLCSYVTLHQCLEKCEASVGPLPDSVWDAVQRRRHLLAVNGWDQQRLCLGLSHFHRSRDPDTLLRPLPLAGSAKATLCLPSAEPCGIDPAWLRDMCQLASAVGDPEQQCAAALCLVHSAIERGDYNHAAQVLVSIKEVVNAVPRWLQFALATEKCKVSVRSSTDEKHICLMLTHFWNVLTQNLKCLDQRSQTDDLVLDFLARWLGCFVETLEPYLQCPPADQALSSVDVLPLSDLMKNMYYEQLNPDAGPPENGSFQSVAQIQSFCLALALELRPKRAQTWKRFAQMLLVPGGGEKEGARVQNAAKALCTCLRLGDHSQVDLEILMQLYALLKDHGELLMEGPEIQSAILTIPSDVWKHLSTQLFSLLSHPSQALRHCLVEILKGIADVAPAKVIFAVMVEWRREQECHAIVPEMETAMEYFQQQNPELLHDVSVFMDEMDRLNSLLSEEWLSFLSEARDESQIRLKVLNEEAKRLRSCSSGVEKDQAFRESYALVMLPLAHALRRGFQEKRAQCETTPYEKRYWTKFGLRCEEVIESLEEPIEEMDVRSIQGKWSQLRTLLKEVSEDANGPLPPLECISPRLAELRDTQIPMPGVESGDVTIAKLGSKIEVLSTKTRPKKLRFIGSNGRSYTFLLKGKEDLHIDERLLQCVRFINDLLAEPRLPLPRVYSVTPLGNQIGLIEWVEQTVSFYALYRQWQKRQQKRLKELNASLPEARSLPVLVTHHPKDVFKEALDAAMRDAELAKARSRAAIPDEILLQVFDRLQKQAPTELLRNELWGTSADPGEQWRKTQRFGQSVALGSVLCYVLGIGDRHLDNMLLDMKTGEVVNIDFNLCFGTGAKLRVPEIVPFRMTRVIQVGLSRAPVSEIGGKTFAAALTKLRKHEAALMELLESVLKDPVMDWTTDRVKIGFCQSLEISLSLQLMVQHLQPEPIQEYLKTLGELQGTISAFLISAGQCSASLAEQEAFQKRQTAELDLLKEELAEEGRGKAELQTAKVLSRQHSQTLEQLHGTLEQMLELNQSWCYRHSRLLMAVLDQSVELMLLSEDKWNSTCTTHSLNLAMPSAVPSVLALLFGEHSPSSFLPKEVIEQCLAVDEHRLLVDGSREAVFFQMLEAMFRYVVTIKALFSIEYLCSSRHFQWMQKLQALVLPEGATLLKERGRPYSGEEVLQMYQAWATAYRRVGTAMMSSASGVSEMLAEAEREAVAKAAAVQTGLSTEWKADRLMAIIRGISQKCLDFCSSQNGSSATEGWSIGQWVKLLLGLCQIFRLIRSASPCRVRHPTRGVRPWLFVQEVLQELGMLESELSGTGFCWLDAAERYVSQLAVLVERMQGGALLDLQVFTQSGLHEAVTEVTGRFAIHRAELQKCHQKKLALEEAQEELKIFVGSYDAERLKTKLELEALTQRLAEEADLCQTDIDTLAQKQQELTTHLYQLNVRWENREDTEAELEHERLDLVEGEVRSIYQRFIWDLCGMSHETVRIESEDDFVEMNLSGKEWGQMHFPFLHAFFQVFELQEAAEKDLCLSLSPPGAPASGYGIGPEIWMQNSVLVAELLERAAEDPEADLHSIAMQHYSSQIEQKIRPLLRDRFTDLVTATEAHPVGAINGISGQIGNPLLGECLWCTDVDRFLSEEVEKLWECLEAQGNFAYEALMQQSSISIMAAHQQDQETRLHHLAAMEWCHGDLLPPHREHLHQYLHTHGILSNLPIPSQSSLLDEMKGPLEKLLEMQEALNRFELESDGAIFSLQQNLLSAFQEQQSLEMMQVLIEGRKAWRDGAVQHISGMVSIVQTLLQFEYSRSGLIWNPGESLDGTSFMNFQMWLGERERAEKGLMNAQEMTAKWEKRLEEQKLRLDELNQQRDECTADGKELHQRAADGARKLEEKALGVGQLFQRAETQHALALAALQDRLSSWMVEMLQLVEGSKHAKEVHAQALKLRPRVERTVEQLSQTTCHIKKINQRFEQCLFTERDPQSGADREGISDFLALSEICTNIQQPVEETSAELTSLIASLNALTAVIRETTDSTDLPPSALPPPEREGLESCPPFVSTTGLSQTAQDVAFAVEPRPLYADAVSNHDSLVLEDLPCTSSCPSPTSLPLPDHPRLNRALRPDQISYAEAILEQVHRRLYGEDETCSTEDLTDALISKTTNTHNLSKMYEGWMPWI